MQRQISAGVLSVACLDAGPPDGTPVVLLHGFPYDIHAYDAVTPLLAAAGCRVLVPYLRGFGPTRFKAPETPRSGQQAALAHDLVALLDALALPRALLAGYDWGGRAACIVAALWPQRVLGLVSGGGYAIQDIAGASRPLPPQDEHKLWYQFYLHGERGRAGLAADRRAFCKLLWRLWSPDWEFGEADFERSAAAFDNPDFVEVAVHSYRHRFGLVAGDPAYQDTECRLAALPRIAVPTIGIDGATDGIFPAAGSSGHGRFFSGPYQRRVIAGAGHNLPQEQPEAFAAAVLQLVHSARKL
ncbi:MAG: alpha/beta hydrolase [Nevskia sp.]|nr:alpha/beta hydrolase [Nevskia sp.]